MVVALAAIAEAVPLTVLAVEEVIMVVKVAATVVTEKTERVVGTTVIVL